MSSYITYKVIDEGRGKNNVKLNQSSVWFGYPCVNKSFCTGYDVTLLPGSYTLECWGAQGGGRNTGVISGGQVGGLGGYSKGILDVSTTTHIYLYIGSSGPHTIGEGNEGFNGGGAVSVITTKRSPGGGSTDFRTIKGINTIISSYAWKSEYIGDVQSLSSRIVVAGGGGGGMQDYNDNKDYPGYGGGTKGGIGGHSQSVSGATQSNPGCHSSPVCGSFGYGLSYPNSDWGTAGGGGGYYGGSTFGSGSGGSGFVSNEMRNGSTLSKIEGFPSINGDIEYGHSGDGEARITINVAFITPGVTPSLARYIPCTCKRKSSSHSLLILYLNIVFISN